MKFSVTYQIVTQESAEDGEASDSGFISQDVCLRDAIADFTGTRTNRVDGGMGIENSGRWFTYYNGMEFDTGAFESRALHPYRTITPSSYRRLARLLGVKS